MGIKRLVPSFVAAATTWGISRASCSGASTGYKLREKDYLELWQYFQKKADDIKEAMFKTLTWNIGFAAALLGFIFVKLTDFDDAKATLRLPYVVIAAAASGLVICLYASFMIMESGKHIRRNWAQADRCRAQVTGLDAIIFGRETMEPRQRAQIWHQLMIVVVLFATAFLALLVWQIGVAWCDGAA